MIKKGNFSLEYAISYFLRFQRNRSLIEGHEDIVLRLETELIFRNINAMDSGGEDLGFDFADVNPDPIFILEFDILNEATPNVFME